MHVGMLHCSNISTVSSSLTSYVSIQPYPLDKNNTNKNSNHTISTGEPCFAYIIEQRRAAAAAAVELVVVIAQHIVATWPRNDVSPRESRIESR